MSKFTLVEIDNELGLTTTKDEGSGITSLDVNIRSGKVFAERPYDRYTKYYNTFGDVQYECNPSTWVLFYTVDFAPNYKFFQEILMRIDNDHMVKVEIGTSSVIEISMKELNDAHFDDQTMISDNLRLSIDSKLLRVNLNNFRGQTLKVYQKRRDASTGDCKMNGIVVVYEELSV